MSVVLEVNSSRELTVANEVKRDCARVTGRGDEVLNLKTAIGRR